jgi:hypothetical protein
LSWLTRPFEEAARSRCAAGGVGEELPPTTSVALGLGVLSGSASRDESQPTVEAVNAKNDEPPTKRRNSPRENCRMPVDPELGCCGEIRIVQYSLSRLAPRS